MIFAYELVVKRGQYMKPDQKEQEDGYVKVQRQEQKGKAPASSESSTGTREIPLKPWVATRLKAVPASAE